MLKKAKVYAVAYVKLQVPSVCRSRVKWVLLRTVDEAESWKPVALSKVPANPVM